MRSATSIALVIVLCAAGPALAQQKKPDVVAKLEGHRGGVSAIAYSPKGDRIATGSGNGVVRLWDARTGELVSRVDQGKHSSARVTSVAFSADGNHLSSSSRTMTGAWDISDPKRLSLRYEDPFGSDPGKLGTTGHAPVEIRILPALILRPDASVTSCGPETVARSGMISTSLLFSVLV